MDLADPQLQQQLLTAQLALKAAQADYKSLQATLQSTLMDKKTAAAQVNADYTQDQLQAQTDKALYDLGVISGLAYNKSEEHGRPADRAAQAEPAAVDVNQKAIVVQLHRRRPRSTRPRRCSISTRSRRPRLKCGPASPARWPHCLRRCRWAST